MSTAPPHQFDLSREQAQRLIAYIQTYRSYSWEHQLPSRERNELLRLLQMVQGKVMSCLDQQQEIVRLVTTTEESTAMQIMASVLIAMYGMKQSSNERDKTLVDLARLKNHIKQLIPGAVRSKTQAFYP